MATPPPDQPSKYGNARFKVDLVDIRAAREFGLLRDNIQPSIEDSSSPEYGLAYDRQENLAAHEFSSQPIARSSFKEFAVRCGFQIFVKQTSVKPNNSGNAKYQCKKLNGTQFFDRDRNFEKIECPFFVNVYGKDGRWKVTKMNFAHNHTKHIGFSKTPFAEGNVPTPAREIHNTTQQIQNMTNLVMSEMLPMHDRSTTTLTGGAIHELLLSKGHSVSQSAISRMKMDIDDRLRGDFAASYQKLESYFTVMSDKNPGCHWKIDREHDNLTFRRACFIPSVRVHIVKMCKKLLGFDGVPLKQCDPDRIGKRGMKPGPKPKHKRKTARNAL